MRNISKLSPPQVLIDSKEEWDTKVQEARSEYNINRYRNADIKTTLLNETNNKCVYCESKIGHNCPGDIEHKIPKSRRLDLIFEWSNMTIACNECNRRKGEYYETSCMFLDPNSDDVENSLQHIGPIVFSQPGMKRSEITVKLLELNSFVRKALIARKIERLQFIKNLVERIVNENDTTVKQFLLDDLYEYCDSSSEFSAMVKTYISELQEGWAD
jgi:uncharacterized protein (TIGR02646 family)